jgi:hypothetical protein
MNQIVFHYEGLGEQIHEQDIHVMMGVLIDKIGMANKPLKESAKTLTIRMQNVWNPKSLFAKLFIGHVSKNAKTAAECLDIQAALIV